MARNPHYQEDRDLIIGMLSAAGWSLTPDGDLTETADLEHEGKTFTLRVQHFSVSDTRGFNLFIAHPDGRELLYMVEYDDHPDEVLKVVRVHSR